MEISRVEARCPPPIPRPSLFFCDRERGTMRETERGEQGCSPAAPTVRRRHPPPAIAAAPPAVVAELPPSPTHLAISAVVEAAVSPVPRRKAAPPPGGGRSDQHPVCEAALICAALDPTGWWRLSTLAARPSLLLR